MAQGPSFITAVHAEGEKFALYLDFDYPLPLDSREPVQFTASLVKHTNPYIGTLTGATGVVNPVTREIRFTSDHGTYEFEGRFAEDFNLITGTLQHEKPESVTFEPIEDD